MVAKLPIVRKLFLTSNFNNFVNVEILDGIEPDRLLEGTRISCMLVIIMLSRVPFMLFVERSN